MKKKKRNNKVIIILVLLIGIGFAYLTTNLDILGIANVSGNRWDVHFENINTIKGIEHQVSEPMILNDTKDEIETSIRFSQPGDEYSYTVDVVNVGTIDAMIDVIMKNSLTEDEEEYLEYSIKFYDDNEVVPNSYLAAGRKERLVITIKYKLDVTEEFVNGEKNTSNIVISLVYKQATSEAITRQHVKVVDMAGDTLSNLDEVRIGNEHFYVVSTNEEETVLIGKYNLMVGKNVSISGDYIGNVTIIDEIDQNTKNYQLQSSEAKCNDERSSCKGYVTLATPISHTIDDVEYNTYYWHNESDFTLKDKYKTKLYNELSDGVVNEEEFEDGITYDINAVDVYDSEYSSESGDNYSVAYYINNYEDILKNDYNANIISSRIPSLSDMYNLGFSKQPYKDYGVELIMSNNEKMTEGSFLLSTIIDLNIFENNIHEVITLFYHKYDEIITMLYNDLGYELLRPIIVVNTSDIEM